MSSEPKPGKRKSDECLTDSQPKKISIKLSEKPPAIAPVKLNIAAQAKHHEPNRVTNPKVQEVFNSDDEEEEEIIPEEARIRMRNLGSAPPGASDRLTTRPFAISDLAVSMIANQSGEPAWIPVMHS
ncbi:uncharacterized protein DEA37_0005290 [Paragonimus westermani]|uniref:PEST proteolytic signal-containing nuclear protein n=1 Tax=Paragonimus westermani TaxID=34504 RepID=A0A5J4NDR0_9TREM|nr:uncharacterized protein DEA37_0005290 [Paragonimus westermani]